MITFKNEDILEKNLNDWWGVSNYDHNYCLDQIYDIVSATEEEGYITCENIKVTDELGHSIGLMDAQVFVERFKYEEHDDDEQITIIF